MVGRPRFGLGIFRPGVSIPEVAVRRPGVAAVRVETADPNRPPRAPTVQPEPFRRLALLLLPLGLLVFPVRAAVWVHEVGRNAECARVGHWLHWFGPNDRPG